MSSFGRFNVWKSERLCSVHFSGSSQWPKWLGLTWCWATLSTNLNPSPRWKKIMSFSVIHQQTSRIIKYYSRYNHDFQYPVLFVNTILTQVDEEEAELFLTPGLTWTTSGNFAQAEVIILFLSFLSLFGIVTQMGPQSRPIKSKKKSRNSVLANLSEIVRQFRKC